MKKVLFFSYFRQELILFMMYKI